MKYLHKMLMWIPTQLILSGGQVPPPPMNVIQAEDSEPLLTETGQPLLVE